MGEVNLDKLVIGESYKAKYLANLWGFKSETCFNGTFHPSNTNIVLLFVSKNKTSDRVQYEDNLENGILIMEGQEKHGSDKYIIGTIEKKSLYKFYLFYRESRKETVEGKKIAAPFVYRGECFPIEYEQQSDKPSKFKFKLVQANGICNIDSLFDYIANENKVYSSAPEGVKKLITHYRFERNANNRKKAIEKQGCICKICGFDFNKVYGDELGDDYIEVHHIKPISNGMQTPNPEKDLIPVCANCHRMLHRRKNLILSVEELQKIVEKNKCN